MLDTKNEKTPKVFCYFHIEDLDGWSASAIVKKKYPLAEFYGYNYEGNLPIVEGYDIVFMVDLSDSLETMKKLKEKNKKFIWIDHHASKIKEVEKANLEFEGLRDSDNNNAACILTWKYLYPDKEVPGLLQYIEDIDLWKFTFKNTMQIVTALDIDYKQDRVMLKEMMENGVWKKMFPILVERGQTYLNFTEHQIDEIIKNAVMKEWNGYKISIINTNVHKSFVGDRLLKINPNIQFVLLWSVEKELVKVSLRGREDINLGEIARRYDGGGHKAAAGFSMKYKEFFKHVLK